MLAYRAGRAPAARPGGGPAARARRRRGRAGPGTRGPGCYLAVAQPLKVMGEKSDPPTGRCPAMLSRCLTWRAPDTRELAAAVPPRCPQPAGRATGRGGAWRRRTWRISFIRAVTSSLSCPKPCCSRWQNTCARSRVGARGQSAPGGGAGGGGRMPHLGVVESAVRGVLVEPREEEQRVHRLLRLHLPPPRAPSPYETSRRKDNTRRTQRTEAHRRNTTGTEGTRQAQKEHDRHRRNTTGTEGTRQGRARFGSTTPPCANPPREGGVGACSASRSARFCS